MKSSARFLAAVAAFLAVAALAPAVRAQTSVGTDTLSVQGRSPFEEGYLSRFSLDRMPMGTRISAMGGAGLAMRGGPEYLSLNPAGLMGLERPQMTSSAVFHTGGTTVNAYPELMDVGASKLLQTSDYRSTPTSSVNYNNVTFGSPLVILGNRGALALSYRRVARTGEGSETRAGVSGPFPITDVVNFGRGDKVSDGLDAFSLGVARALTDWFDLGVNLNFETGTLRYDRTNGFRTFNFLLNGGYNYDQDVSGLGIDLGGLADFGRFRLGGAAYLGHDLTFGSTTVRVRPIPIDVVSDRVLAEVRLPKSTLSVPTQIGLGAAMDVSSRLTVAADYWIRPWSKAEITRDALTADVGFSDPSDSSTFYTRLVPAGGKTTLNAGYEDANGLRLGLEFMLHRSDRVQVPLQLGFRTEKLPLTDYVVPGSYNDYRGMVRRFFHGSEAAGDSIRAVVRAYDLIFRGDAVSAGVLSFGLGMTIDAFSLSASVERKSYDVDTSFLDGFNPDPRFNALSPAAVSETRRITTFYLTSRMRF